MHQFFSIGEVSKISHLPIKTLRYYDDIGLLKPAFIDSETRYRYYSKTELFYISIIKELKLFEFSLSDIKTFLQRQNLHQIPKLYAKRKKEILDQMEHLQKIKQRIETRFEAFSDFFQDPQQPAAPLFEIKSFSERTIVSIRKRTPFNLDEFALRCIQLHNLIEEDHYYIKSPFFSIFYDGYADFNPDDTDVETGGEIHPPHTPMLSPHINKLPAGLFASTICKGSHEQSVGYYLKLKEWIKEKGYAVCGPTIKFYILNSKLTKLPENHVSELQILIRKIN